MSTPVFKVYDAFLAKVSDDEWATWLEEDAAQDWKAIMMGAIPRFKFPRHSLEIERDHFVEDLSNIEIQIIAQYMKVEWLNREILHWENIRPLYTERDFSPAKMLEQLKALLETEKHDALELERIYYRSIDGKPYKFSEMAGD